MLPPCGVSTYVVHRSEVAMTADHLSRKVMGSTLRVLLGVEHSRAGPPGPTREVAG